MVHLLLNNYSKYDSTQIVELYKDYLIDGDKSWAIIWGLVHSSSHSIQLSILVSSCCWGEVDGEEVLEKGEWTCSFG